LRYLTKFARSKLKVCEESIPAIGSCALFHKRHVLLLFSDFLAAVRRGAPEFAIYEELSVD
jgi:hypothetical protein